MIREANLQWQYQDTDCGLIMPWYTLPCLQWLKKQDVSMWTVHEYGCGYSTIWWKLHCLKLTSIDHDEKWATAMGSFFTREKDPYLRAFPNDLCDCIIIDGKWRSDCLVEAINYISQGGYIIIDNWGQEDFPDTEFAEKLLQDWEKQIFKQPNHTNWCTAVFRKP